MASVHLLAPLAAGPPPARRRHRDHRTSRPPAGYEALRLGAPGAEGIEEDAPLLASARQGGVGRQAGGAEERDVAGGGRRRCRRDPEGEVVGGRLARTKLARG